MRQGDRQQAAREDEKQGQHDADAEDLGAAEQALMRMDQFRGRVYMPTTAEARTQPASGPASAPASAPSSGPASAPASATRATQPAGSS